MNKFQTVVQYELKDYLCNKAFIIITVLLALAGCLGTFAPRVFDLSKFTGVEVVGHADDEGKEKSEDEIKKNTFLYVDETGLLEEEILTAAFPGKTWQKAENAEVVRTAIQEKEAGAGFVVSSLEEFDYYVYNKGLTDRNQEILTEVLKQIYRTKYCVENGLDPEEILGMLETPVKANENLLGKDAENGYMYCYILVFVVFFLVVYYGQMIATSVTSEKSNRAIEVLVTSTTPNSLLFGKVIAGAVAGLLQVGVIMGAIIAAYKFNHDVWGGTLDMFLNIPGKILLAFAAFGLGGFLFFMFLFGAMGAMVSKTEDVSKSTGGLMFLTVIVYYVVNAQLGNVDGPVMKVLSFLPFSSYSSMFARIAMGTVSTGEIILSFAILVVSIIGVGILGAKLYRMGTLRYGNPIKLSTALKDLGKSE
ncbi:MAG: ABC transporter permease [Blautia sp.]|nr:ABC transporter permease [Blautia sp.]